jgi:CheY-like chemotaxis protein
MLQHMTRSGPRTCLLVDDSRPILSALAQLLAGEGYEPTTAETGVEALESLAGRSFDAVILDYRLPDISGLDVARAAAGLTSCPIVFYTSYADQRFVVDALDAGARAVVLKDAPPANLLQALETVVAGDIYVDPRLPLRPSRCLP